MLSMCPLSGSGWTIRTDAVSTENLKYIPVVPVQLLDSPCSHLVQVYQNVPGETGRVEEEYRQRCDNNEQDDSAENGKDPNEEPYHDGALENGGQEQRG